MKLGRKVLIPIMATTTLVFGAALIVGSVTAENWATPIVDDLAWQKLDAKQIPQLVDEGKTVFVDVTADWSISCDGYHVLTRSVSS